MFLTSIYSFVEQDILDYAKPGRMERKRTDGQKKIYASLRQLGYISEDTYTQAVGDSPQWYKSARPTDGFMSFLESKKLPSSQFQDIMKTLASIK